MIDRVRRCATVSLVAALFAVFATAQTPQATNSASNYQLRVGGEVERELKLSLTDLAKLPRRSVRAKDHGGVESTFEGVALIDILDRAGVKFGEGLRGKSLALYLVGRRIFNDDAS